MFIDSHNQISKEKLRGKVIAYPTDTVFGIGAMIDDLEAINKIYKLKKRSSDKPLAILASKVEDIFNIMKKYWPGALTIIFKKKHSISSQVVSKIDTIAFRIPNNAITLNILEKTGPLATTSVNISGDNPINTYQEIDKLFGDKIDYLLVKNVNSSNISSTIIDVSDNHLKIVRQGEIKIL